MAENAEIEEAFTASLRLLFEFGSEIGDKTLYLHFAGEIEKLHLFFIEWVKANQSLNKERKRILLTSQINNLINFLIILKSLKTGRGITNVQAEKTLLQLKLKIMPELKRQKLPGKEAETKKNSESENDKNYRSRVIMLINEKGPMTSVEVYDKFPEISRRSVRRILSNLVQSGEIIKNTAENSSVYGPNLSVSGPKS